MKITEETKIKDILPEGYEVVKTHQNVESIVIEIKRKQKDFGRYSIEYLAKLIALIYPDAEELMEKSPVRWRWEFRMGLLKYICDENKVDFYYCLHSLNMSIDNLNYVSSKITSICPEEFLKSLV